MPRAGRKLPQETKDRIAATNSQRAAERGISSAVIIEGTRYVSVGVAARTLGINKSTLLSRIRRGAPGHTYAEDAKC